MPSAQMVCCSLALGVLPAFAGDPSSGPTGLHRDVVFTAYSDYSRSEEMVRRLFTPLVALRINRAATRMGKALREQAVELANEKFTVYVPPDTPEHGYSLLVFVSPWSNAEVPAAWISVLNSHAMIFVSPDSAGNDANVLDRREPLALLAAKNILDRYPVNPQRVYVGGFSGGSRVALRLALGYPDVFHGALLHAGSDPIGDEHVPLPPAELFRRFQESMRLVYLTGERDSLHVDEDARSQQSMRQWCVFNVVNASDPWNGHQLAPAPAFAHALDLLLEEAPVDAHRLAECRAHLDAGMTALLQQAAALLAKGQSPAAHRLLEKIDVRYGGLAAPRSVELEGQ